MIQESGSKYLIGIQQELALVKKLADITTQASNIAQVYRAFALEVERYIGADWAAVVLFDDGEFRIQPLNNSSNSLKATLPSEEQTLVHLVASERAVIETGLSASAARWLGCPSGAKSIAWLPLKAGGENFGALVLVSLDDDAFRRRHLTLLEHFARFFALALRSFELENENKAIKRENSERMYFTDVLVHELKTVLTSIIASVGLLEDELTGKVNEVQFRLIQNLSNSAKNLDSRVSELSDLARAGAGSFPLHLELSSIGPVLRGALNQVASVAESKGQALVLRLPRSLPRVMIDQRRLEQVILNLLSNAIKFTPDGGRITIQVGVRNSDLLVEVKDSGTPIPEEERQRLFLAYHHQEVDRQQLPGLGIGLAIARQLIEAHGGKIWLSSKAGEGNTFYLSLPCANT